MPLILNLPSLPTPLVTVLLTSLLPTVSAAGAGGTVNTSGFWLGFSLIVVISAAESAFSVIWTRIRATSNGIHPSSNGIHPGSNGIHPGSNGIHPGSNGIHPGSNGIHPGSNDIFSVIWTRIRVSIYSGPNGISTVESAFSVIWTRIRVTSNGNYFGPNGIHRSCRVCGREIAVSSIDPEKASEIVIRGGGGCGYVRERSVTMTYGLTKKTVIDQFGNLRLVLALLIRRFNPNMSMEAPARLINTVKDLVSPRRDNAVVHVFEHAVDLLISLTDVSLGVAVLALNPSSPQELYDTLKDPEASMTFQNCTTLFLLYWLLCMIPQRSARASIQIFGWPGKIAFAVAGFASLALFCLGCWKIDFARRHHTPWTPMLSYWISGASAVAFPVHGIDLFDILGTVGLVFMLIHTFN